MVYGLWLLIVTFFKMPIIVWKGTKTQLEALAEQEEFDMETTGSPCMTWIAFSGKAFISILNLIIVAVAVLSGIYNLFGGIFGPIGFATGLGRMIIYPILGYLGAVVVTWALSYWFELILLGINVANDIRALRQESMPKPNPTETSDE
ncbi:hypothetical protein AMJ86_08980 [bacterium SM23_57]|nr:MAG: hypothetical protein AMJ86_08980 [bacterium SM23_57]